MPIHILIVDDCPIFRLGLRWVCELERDLKVVGEAENGRTAVALACDLQPDVVLMDIEMPILGGVQATRLITAQNPSTRVLALTTCSKDGHVLPVIRAGAYGCLPKDIKDSTLIKAIRAVHRGEALIDPHVTARVLDELRRVSEHGAHSPV